MKRSGSYLVLALLAAVLAVTSASFLWDVPSASAVALAAQADPPFPDAHEAPPAGWKGPVFKLRQDYPTTAPPKEALPWDAIDPKTDGIAYARAVLKYVYEGNIAVDWQVEKNKIRNWYHAPWMHSGNAGREFVRGLTRERTTQPKELAPTQTSRFQNWAVSVYNAPGGFVIGQVWKNHKSPNPKLAVFPNGTVGAKLLFSEANETEVPYLKGDVEWDANVNQPMTATTRKVSKMRLLQIDVAVRDTRVESTTGWVFGTFVYDGNSPGATPWDRMVPVGVMWGNDPAVPPSKKGKLTETRLNPDLGVPQHLGFGGRLNGPVDNPRSSCLSCHAVSQYESAADMMPPTTAPEAEKMKWFRNVKAGQPFTAGETSLDYSLQLSAGIQHCLDAKACAVIVVPAPGTNPITAAPAPGTKKIFPVTRGQ